MKDKKITTKVIRSCIKQLMGKPLPKQEPLTPENINPNVKLTVSGVVWFDGRGFMHPNAFRDMFGEDCYQELLKRPRIITEYDEEGVDYIISKEKT